MLSRTNQIQSKIVIRRFIHLKVWRLSESVLKLNASTKKPQWRDLLVNWKVNNFKINLSRHTFIRMTCPISYLSTISTIIVAIQFFTKVVPWFYENIIGPMILGPKLKLLDYGEWACKYIRKFTIWLKTNKLKILISLHRHMFWYY